MTKKDKEKKEEKPEVLPIKPRKVLRKEVLKLEREDNNDRRLPKTGSRK